MRAALTALWGTYITAAASGAVLALLVQRRLWRLVPCFAVALAVRLAQAFSVAGLSPESREYFRLWVLSESVLLGAVCLAAFEAYLHFNRSIYRAGRVGALLVMAGGSLGAAVALFTSTPTSAEWNEIAASLLSAKRSLYAGFGVALMLLLLVYRRLRVPVASYVWPHALLLVANLFVNAAAAWSSAWLGRRGLQTFNEAQQVALTVCLAGWLWLFAQPVSWPRSPSPTEVEAAEDRAKRLARIVDSSASQ